MAPLEPWEKVLVNADFINSIHGRAGCIACHGGRQSPDKDTAHSGLIADPSQDAGRICGACHGEIVDGFPTSLHASLQGYRTVVYSARESSRSSNCHAEPLFVLPYDVW